MDFLGVGPLEILFILVIALIVLGPKDMVKAGRTLGRLLRKVVTSPTWHAIQQTSRDLRYLPNKLIREAGLEDLEESLPKVQLEELDREMKHVKEELSEWTTPPITIEPPSLPSIKPETTNESAEDRNTNNDLEKS